ncbi:MAG: hypothetical protein P1U53_07815 [Sulfitobacter sp.]|nr:hypothetical protein [Sulfitobacter sp.]
MTLTRNILAGLALALGLSGPLLAGAIQPVVEPAIIVEEAASSSSGTALVAILAVLLALPLLDD